MVNGPKNLLESASNSPLATMPSSPSVGNVGLGTRTISGSGFLEHIDASSSQSIIANKLSSIPSPGEKAQWAMHTERPSATEMYNSLQNWRQQQGKLSPVSDTTVIPNITTPVQTMTQDVIENTSSNIIHTTNLPPFDHPVVDNLLDKSISAARLQHQAPKIQPEVDPYGVFSDYN